MPRPEVPRKVRPPRSRRTVFMWRPRSSRRARSGSSVALSSSPSGRRHTTPLRSTWVSLSWGSAAIIEARTDGCAPLRSPQGEVSRARLAVFAHVRPAARGHELADRPAAHGARLAGAAVHEELVLEGAADAVGVAEVVDGRPARRDPGAQRLHD